MQHLILRIIALVALASTSLLQLRSQTVEEATRTLRLLTYTIPNNVSIGGILNVTKNATISTGLKVSAGGAAITGNTSITGDTTITGNTTVTGNVMVKGVVSTPLMLNSNLTCTGFARLNKSVFMTGIVGKSVDVLTYTPVLINTTTGQLGTVASSKRYKDDIQGLPSLKAELMQLRPVSFTYKTDPNKIIQYGLIAEEVESVLPELVVYNKDQKAETVAYHILPTLLLNEYQDHENRLTSVESEITALNKLRNNVAAMQEIVDQLVNLIGS